MNLQAILDMIGDGRISSRIPEAVVGNDEITEDELFKECSNRLRIALKLPNLRAISDITKHPEYSRRGNAIYRTDDSNGFPDIFGMDRPGRSLRIEIARDQQGAEVDKMKHKIDTIRSTVLTLKVDMFQQLLHQYLRLRVSAQLMGLDVVRTQLGLYTIADGYSLHPFLQQMPRILQRKQPPESGDVSAVFYSGPVITEPMMERRPLSTENMLRDIVSLGNVPALTMKRFMRSYVVNSWDHIPKDAAYKSEMRNMTIAWSESMRRPSAKIAFRSILNHCGLFDPDEGGKLSRLGVQFIAIALETSTDAAATWNMHMLMEKAGLVDVFEKAAKNLNDIQRAEFTSYVKVESKEQEDEAESAAKKAKPDLSESLRRIPITGAFVMFLEAADLPVPMKFMLLTLEEYETQTIVCLNAARSAVDVIYRPRVYGFRNMDNVNEYQVKMEPACFFPQVEQDAVLCCNMNPVKVGTPRLPSDESAQILWPGMLSVCGDDTAAWNERQKDKWLPVLLPFRSRIETMEYVLLNTRSPWHAAALGNLAVDTPHLAKLLGIHTTDKACMFTREWLVSARPEYEEFAFCRGYTIGSGSCLRRVEDKNMGPFIF